jgi:N-methylhydantoinase B
MTADAVARPTVDPMTLAVVQGALTSAVAEMSTVVERTARSAIIALAHDFSNAVYTHANGVPEMIVQGQDQPCHLGGMLSSVRSAAAHFGDDLAPGDVIIGNHPALNGTHLLDVDLIEPVFWSDRLVGWTCSRAHQAELGGPVAGGYNPQAEELFAECLILPPTKIAIGGELREDVLALILANVRGPETLRGDFGAQLSAARTGARRLVELYDRYGDVVDGACTDLLNRAERIMRQQIRAIPDGVYVGEEWIEEDGRGTPASPIGATVEVRGDELHIAITSPPQCRSYRNSYWGLTVGAVYFAVLSAMEPGLPMNEGLYRAVRTTPPPEGSMLNPTFPAACQSSTADVWGVVFDAVCDALSHAVPERACAGWHKIATFGVSGVDPRTREFYASGLHIANVGGAGAVTGLDGGGLWGIVSTGGGASVGDIETLEVRLPLHFHRHELDVDSASPGRWRGHNGAVLDFEVLGHTAQFNHVGNGARFPAASRLGGGGPRDAGRLTRKRIVHPDGCEEPIPLQTIRTASHGDRVVVHIPGGGGIGDPLQRESDAIAADIENGYISAAAAEQEYGPRPAVVDAGTAA